MSRQQLVESYWNARTNIESANVEDSIIWLEKYSSLLPSEISHEPKYWLVEQYLKIGDDLKAIESAKLYLEGCSSYPHASNKAKVFADLFKSYKYLNHSFTMIKLSKKFIKMQEKLRKKSK